MSEAWDLLAWWGTPSSEEARHKQAGRPQSPTVLAYGVTLSEGRLDAEIVTVTRRLRKGPRKVRLYRGQESRDVTVLWDDCLKPARWGGASFRRV